MNTAVLHPIIASSILCGISRRNIRKGMQPATWQKVSQALRHSAEITLNRWRLSD
jgi:hypothetical protein